MRTTAHSSGGGKAWRKTTTTSSSCRPSRLWPISTTIRAGCSSCAASARRPINSPRSAPSRRCRRLRPARRKRGARFARRFGEWPLRRTGVKRSVLRRERGTPRRSGEAALYIPKHYEVADPAVLHSLIDAHPLGAWVRSGADGLAVDHIPFLVDAARGEFGTLVGHVAKANPLWRELADGRESVVIFRGPDAYVSPSWYPSKR